MAQDMTAAIQAAMNGSADPFAASDQAAASLYGVPSALTQVPVDLGDHQRDLYQEYVNAGVPKDRIPVAPGTKAPSPADLISLPKANSHIYDLDQGSLSQLQRRLWDAGLMDKAAYKDGYQPGVVDDYTEAAWQSATLAAAKSRKTVQDIINERTAAVQKAGGLDAMGLGGEKPQRYNVYSGVDLAHVLNAQARDLVGHELAPDEINHFITQYMGQQKAAGAATTGAVETTTPETAAEQFVQQGNPEEVQAMRMVHIFDTIRQRIGNAQGVTSAGQLTAEVK